MTALYLVRHAQPVYQGYQEAPELAPLSEKGRADSERLADFLQGKGIEQIYSSPYPRAVQTLEPLARRLGLPIELEPDLRERTVGSWVEDFSAFARRQWEDFDYRLEQGESLRQVQQRAVPALERLAQRSKGKTIAVGGHGTAISVLLHSFGKGGFGYSDFCRIREKTPWVVRLTFAGSECVAVEEVWEEG